MNLLTSISWLEEGPFALYRWGDLVGDIDIFIDGLIYTLGLSLAGLLFAFVLGTIIGIVSSSRSRVLTLLTRIYVEFFQNTPLLIQIFFVYYGLPLVGIVIDTYVIGIICIGLYHAAYIAEVIRSGIGSIPKGQMEASLSQGFSYWEAMWYIILPQAMRVMLPSLTNQVVNLIKNTSAIAVISGTDIMFVANTWSSMNLHYVPAFAFVAFLYFVLCFPLTQLSAWLEGKNKKAY